MQDNRFNPTGLRKKKKNKNGNSSREYGASIMTQSSRPLTSTSTEPVSYILGHHLMGFEKDGDFFYLLADALGSTRMVVDENAEVVQLYSYDEWGNQLPGSGQGIPQSPKTYLGGLSVNDDTGDSGLYLMGHRFYDPSLGRFLNRDPIGFAGGDLNLFRYAGGNPTTYVDPTGLRQVPPAPAPMMPPPTVPGPLTGGPSPTVIQAWNRYRWEVIRGTGKDPGPNPPGQRQPVNSSRPSVGSPNPSHDPCISW